MKILMTGASGFLGKFLAKKLEGHELVLLDSKKADLTKENALEPWSNQRFDRIIHLAAWTQAGDFCLRHPGQQWMINQKINTHVLTWWHEKQPQAKMIAMGTSCSYDEKLPLEEKNYLVGTPIDSLYTYAMTKRMLLVGLQALHKQFGHQYLYLVPSTLYGPDYHKDGRQMHFIFDLIRKILAAKATGEPVVLWGDGHQKRELVHVDDFADALVKLDAHSNKVLNIGGGKEHSIREFAQMICDEVGYPFEKIQFDTSKYVGAKSKILSIEALRQVLPEYAPRDLRVGLKETIEGMRK